MGNLINRFIKYVKVDTESDASSTTVPTTAVQLEFAKVLVDELKSIGLSDVSVDEKAYVMATLPSNIDKDVPVVGFIAHMDTSPDFSGNHVNPQFVENYDGGDIVLNKDLDITLSPKDFPELKKWIGNTLITTDGTTLLGADDKAGIAEIVTAMEYLVQHPEIKHGTIKVGFTPDEEVGRGADYFDVEKFGADFAYTMDGGELGEMEYENFNAAGATLVFKGRSVHPGFAKNKMKNSILYAQELMNMLPAQDVPQHTTGYEGFFHLMDIKGGIEHTELQYIIRDHDREKYEHRKEMMQKAADLINHKYGEGTVECTITDQYFNMCEKIEPVMYIVDMAVEAMKECGVAPLVKAIRGGTDGARLSYMGLPCPNIFTGGQAFHGKFEHIPVESMEKAVEVILAIVQKTTERS